jgi:hypothetical protein
MVAENRLASVPRDVSPNERRCSIDPEGESLPKK